jgi:hypothetical protein
VFGVGCEWVRVVVLGGAWVRGDLAGVGGLLLE